MVGVLKIDQSQNCNLPNCKANIFKKFALFLIIHYEQIYLITFSINDSSVLYKVENETTGSTTASSTSRNSRGATKTRAGIKSSSKNYPSLSTVQNEIRSKIIDQKIGLKLSLIHI